MSFFIKIKGLFFLYDSAVLCNLAGSISPIGNNWPAFPNWYNSENIVEKIIIFYA